MRDYTRLKVPPAFIDKVIRPACGGDPAIVSAFETVPREYFMDEAMHLKAYTDNALPIGFGQTISQPSLVAMMLKELEPSKKLTCLEIGAGSGFVSALLGRLMEQVYSIELIDGLTKIAQQKLRSMMIWNVQAMTSNGALGYADKAPFDRIIVSAGANSMPQPLIDQLSPEGGIMIIPLAGTLTKVVKNGDDTQTGQLAKVSFVNFVHT